MLTSVLILFPPLFDPYQILENTPENHPDHSNLKLALERAEELCSQVNEGVREKENSDRLEWIQSHVQCEGLAEVAALIRCTVETFPSHFRKAGGERGSLLTSIIGTSSTAELLAEKLLLNSACSRNMMSPHWFCMTLAGEKSLLISLKLVPFRQLNEEK